MPGDPLRHTESESLKRVLRRRARRHKVGANSGAKVQLHAWHARSQFTPSGAASVQWLGILIVGAVALLLALWAAFTVWAVGAILFADDMNIPEKITGVLTVVIVLSAPVWFTALVGWIYVRLDGNNKASRKRLSDAADKLLAKRTAAKDEGANHAR